MQKHIPRHRFGQHFLHDQRILLQIVEALHPQENQHLLEIGPGLGALTQYVLPKAKQLTVIEIDRDVIPHLKKLCEPLGNLVIYQQDILTAQLNDCSDEKNQRWRVFGNLPYNISTPLLFHLLKQRDGIIDMLFMVQKEVADRMTAACHHSSYGRLSVMLQYACTVEKLFDVPASAFYPPPKVESSVVYLKPYHRNILAQDELLFSKVVAAAFQMRRKTIRNSLKAFIQDWSDISLDPSLRAENITVEEYINLSNRIAKKEKDK